MIIGHAKLCHLIIENHHRTEPVQGRSIAQWGTRDIRVFWGTAGTGCCSNFTELQRFKKIYIYMRLNAPFPVAVCVLLKGRLYFRELYRSPLRIHHLFPHLVSIS